jgi:hypothetical protein
VDGGAVSYARVKGLSKLVSEVVEHGSRAVERIHLGTAARPFAVLEAIPAIAAPAYAVRVVHDGVTRAVYASVRGVNKVAFVVVDAAIEAAEAASEEP